MICLNKPEVQIVVTKFATFVHVVCGNLCSNFCYTSTRNTFEKVIAKILKIPMDPSSRTREWLPSVLILRGLYVTIFKYSLNKSTETIS